MYTNSLLLNALGKVDRAFFLICLAIVVVIIAVYFLTPVFRKSQYEERRENLRKREAAFKSSRIKNDTAGVFAETNTDEAEQVMPTSEVTETTEN